jgi:hypothetical protein
MHSKVVLASDVRISVYGLVMHVIFEDAWQPLATHAQCRQAELSVGRPTTVMCMHMFMPYSFVHGNKPVCDNE